MKKKIGGSLTIEAAIIVPIILWVFAVIIMLLIYYHDKNVVTAVAYETAVVGCKAEEVKLEDVEVYFQKRLSGKLLLFSSVKMEAKIREKEVTITCKTLKKGMKLKTMVNMRKTKPESYVRKLQWIKKFGEELSE